MSRTLVTVAVLGLGAAVILLGAAAMLGGGHVDIPGIVSDDPPPGKPQTRDFAWSGGDSIRIDAPSATVRLVPGATPRVTIRAAARVLDRIELHDDTLELPDGSSLRDRIFFWGRHEQIDVTLSGMTLRDIDLEGSGKLILGHIDQDRLAIRISGAGKASGEGRVEDLDATVSGTGDLSLGRLAARNARVTISGVGNADISASDEADITLSGVGNVHLPTRPKKLVKHISGVGHVEGPDGDQEDNKEN